MRKYLLLLLIPLLLDGCVGGGTAVRGTGEVAPTPEGFVDYCKRHPEKAECGGTR